MSKQGTIVSWKSDRGFGFIRPDKNGADVFVHIRAFSRNSQPSVGDRVRYSVNEDDRGRIRAVRVRRRSDRIRMTFRASARPGAACLFFLIIAWAVYLQVYPAVILYLYLTASLVCGLVYAWDKWSAQRGRSRISENNLHFLAIIGGWPGALMAQQLFRHKSRKKSFQITFWITVLLNCGALIWLLTPSGKPYATQLFGFLQSLVNHLHARTFF